MVDVDLLQVGVVWQGEGQVEVDCVIVYCFGYCLGIEQGDVDGDVWVVFVYCFEYVGQQVVGYCFDGGDFYMVGVQVLQCVQFGMYVFYVLQDYGDVVCEDFFGFGQVQVVGQVVEQWCVDFVFQFEDLLVYC